MCFRDCQPPSHWFLGHFYILRLSWDTGATLWNSRNEPALARTFDAGICWVILVTSCLESEATCANWAFHHIPIIFHPNSVDKKMMVTPPLGSRVRVSTGPQIWNQICSNCAAHCSTMHRNQIPRSNSTFSNILVSLIGLVIGLAALTLFGRLGPVVGLPILCLLVFIFRRSSGTRSQEGTRGTGATRAARAACAACALLRSPEVPNVKLPVTIVRLQELSPGKSKATATGSTGVRWSKVTLFWKAVMILNSACWGSTFIGTKSGIDALKAADVRNPGPVFGLGSISIATMVGPLQLSGKCSHEFSGGTHLGYFLCVYLCILHSWDNWSKSRLHHITSVCGGGCMYLHSGRAATTWYLYTICVTLLRG